MAIIVLTNAQVLVNGVDLSDHVQKVQLDDSRDKVDITAMGAINKAYAKGIGDGGATITFFQDFAAAKVHATLQPLIGSSTTFSLEVRPVNGPRTATNPAFLMTALLFDYSMLNGAVGDAATMDVPFANASQSGITYPTS